jgi:hypothetical protein
MTATFLAPAPVSKFFDNNGQPLAGGLVYTYSAGTNTPIATYKDSTGGSQNTNPIVLNSRGEASIWLLPNIGYKLNVTDSAGNQLPGYPVDNIVYAALLSLFGGIDTGVANAYIINFSSPVPANTNGQVIYWLPSNSNTGPSTINVNGAGPQPILNPNGTVLGANQILANQYVAIISINGIWQLYGGSGVGVNIGTFGAEVPLASAATTDLGSVPGHNVQITGSAAITSFGTSAQVVAPIYIVRVSGTPTLTVSSSLILPGNTNINAQNGDSFLAEYMGSGNWRVLIYQYASGTNGYSVVKPADTSRLSTTTLTADPDLVTPTLQIGKYTFELFMLFDSVAAGAGFKFTSNGTATDSRATSPAVATGLVNASAYGPKLESFYGATITYATVSTSTNGNGVLYKGSLLISTAGTFGVSWAQNASTASNTTLRAGSYLTTNLLALGGATPGVTRIYTTPGAAVETIPAGFNTLTIEVWGAGGGGGARFGDDTSDAGGGGGGSGGYCRTSISVTGAGGQNINYQIGTGGVGTAGAGTTGGFSNITSGSFTVATMTANGGVGGTAASSLTVAGNGGAGGTASGGSVINTSGSVGSAGQTWAAGGAGGLGGTGIPGIYSGGTPGGRGRGTVPGNPGGNGIVVFNYA